MYRVLLTQHTTSLNVNESAEGETIEEKLDRIVNNNEPITDGAPLIYQERDEQNWQTDIRSDKFEIMIEARDKIQRDAVTKNVNTLREAAAKEKGDNKSTDQNTGGNQET